ncbi:hypothetical protein MPOCJGCO_2953 [Methylobacterium trifolii]|uniref:Uncharacterized protein n=1 Tax=Methylobacterium trifolii TaxID=1003092 RepID=A0ABQ4U036_9HYPH|nr:hypothetical protein MPOCJGCO_2953 [Methylobacterium trifolii]
MGRQDLLAARNQQDTPPGLGGGIREEGVEALRRRAFGLGDPRQGSRGEAGEAFQFSDGAPEDFVALVLEMQSGDAHEAGQEHRKQGGDGVAQTRLDPAETGMPARSRPGDAQNRIRTRGEGSGIRLRHGRTP